MCRCEYTTIIEPAYILGSILTSDLMWVDSDRLLLKGKSRKALCGADFRHKKRRPLTSIDVPMVPKAGLEPARISTVDFESTASTDFATSALKGMRKRCGLYLSHAAMQAATCSSAAKCPKNQRNPTAVTDPTPHNVSARRRSALAGPARCSTDPAPGRSSASLCPSLFAASAAARYRRRTSRSASG